MRRGYLLGACVMLLLALPARGNGPTREELEIQPSGPVRLPERRAYSPAFVSEAARQGERRFNYARPYDFTPFYSGYYSDFDYGYLGWGYGFASFSCFGAPACVAPPPPPRYDFGYGPLGHHPFVGPVPVRLLNRLYR